MLRAATASDRIAGNQRGASLTEVMVTIGIVTSILGVGILSLDRGYLNLTTAKQGLINDLRRARMQATLKGTHFRFEAMGSKYSIARLTKNGNGSWVVDPAFPAKVVDLPKGFSLAVTSGGATPIAEFDGRGLLVPTGNGPASIINLAVSDGSGKYESIQIWPSGQVEDDPYPYAG